MINERGSSLLLCHLTLEHSRRGFSSARTGQEMVKERRDGVFDLLGSNRIFTLTKLKKKVKLCVLVSQLKLALARGMTRIGYLVRCFCERTQDT